MSTMMPMSQEFRSFIERLKEDPYFVASAIRLWDYNRELSDEETVDFLKTTKDNLIRLSACRRPRRNKENYFAEVGKLAVRYQCNADALLEILLEADAMEEKLHTGDFGAEDVERAEA